MKEIAKRAKEGEPGEKGIKQMNLSNQVATKPRGRPRGGRGNRGGRQKQN